MARDGPDTATSDFFICIGDQPELDFGGKRNPDGQGFAAFGRVVKGMDVVGKIQASPADGQTLAPPVKIRKVTRKPPATPEPSPAPEDMGVWPDRDWSSATPESQGLSGAGLGAVAEYALKAGGGSGCVIRHGYLVKEWGSPAALADVKSATKGSVGTTLLGLAVDDGLVRLDDLARKHYPRIGAEKPENVATGWLDQITVRHLATMTAGFDDGRPALLAYRPGTRGIYSNDTSNMLAELLTLRFREDLRSVFKRRVMDPIDTPEAEWAWRPNQYRARAIDDLPSREFAAGLTITHRALARLGYLYLHEGNWKGRQILSRQFVRTATRPTDLPAPYPFYALYWGSNARGTFAGIPRDAFWALGLGDSFVLVCPSLDLVAVRLGVGSTKSQLPGGEKPEDWGKRVEQFGALLVRAVRDPCPPSPVIRRVDWAPPGAIVRKAKGSDNWPMTWADDDHLYTAYGDGNGFEPYVPEKLSLGFARIAGLPPDFTGSNIRSASGEQKGNGKAGKKGSGLLMVDGVLYLWARNAGNAQLAWSADHGQTWQWADWKLTTSFGCPTFLNFGENYAGARDDYVYVYSHDADSAYQPADRMVLARVPKGKIRQREAYEFFKGLDAGGQPSWTKDAAERGAVFTHAGRCYRSGISYDAPLKRYLWCQTLPGDDPRFKGGFGVFDAPEPWGPWTTVYYTEAWDVGPGETSSLPTKWMSPDGKSLHLVFSGGDAFCVRKLTLLIAE
jgi:CubicO group peptidase (beta-lactamase class C family)